MPITKLFLFEGGEEKGRACQRAGGKPKALSERKPGGRTAAAPLFYGNNNMKGDECRRACLEESVPERGLRRINGPLIRNSIAQQQIVGAGLFLS